MAEAKAAPENYWEEAEKKIKNKGDLELVLWYYVDRKVIY
jgi:hypothetical protein